MTFNVAVKGGNDCCTSSLHAYCCLNTVGGSTHVPLIITRNCTKYLPSSLQTDFLIYFTGTSLCLGTTLSLSILASQLYCHFKIKQMQQDSDCRKISQCSKTTFAPYLWKPLQCMLMLKSVSREPWQENCCYDEGAYHEPPVRKLSYEEVDFVEFAW